MEQFGWTEKELYEQNTMERIREIFGYNYARNLAERERQRKSEMQSKSKRGAIVR